MPHVLPQVAIHRVIQEGLQIVKANINVLDDIFLYYLSPEMNSDYGQPYIEKIKTWLTNTKIPVVQAWALTPSKVPQVSIQLAQESEAEDKAAMGDFWGPGTEAEVGVGVFNVTLDIMLYGSKNTDEVLWLYYIVSYILFKRKRQAEALGLQLHTFSATDYARDNPKIPENIWVRTIKFRALVQNFWDAEPFLDIGKIDVNVQYETATEEGDLPQGTLIELDNN